MPYADLVEQETTTTGTGTYTVSGAAPAGRRTFLEGFPEDTPAVPYVVTDDAGNFECGIGNWDSAGTITRTVVLASSNSGAAVNWSAGTKRVYCGAHSGVMGMAAIRHNTSASGVPTTDDNFSDGYGYGSIWVYDKVAYICVASGIWRPASPLRDDNNNEKVELLDSSGECKARLDSKGALHLGIEDPEYVPGGNLVAGVPGIFMSDGYTLISDLQWSTYTTDATPTKMSVLAGGSTWPAAVYAGTSGVVVLEAVVTAVKDSDPTTVKAWKVICAAVNDGSGTMTLGTPTITELYESAGATGWDAGVVVDTNGSSGNQSGIALQVTGAAATPIGWLAAVRGLVNVVPAV